MDTEKDQEEESKILPEDDSFDEEDEEGEADDGEKNDAMEKYCGNGRVWIFLALGLLAIMFSAVLVGVHINIRAVTSSLNHVEVVPSILPPATGALAGLFVLSLFWRRYKLLVYGTLVMCLASTTLCLVSSALTGTHVLKPLLSVSGCEYRHMEKACRCATSFRRIGISLEEVPMKDQVYLTMEGTLGCEDVQTLLPGLVYTMVGVYGLVAIVCLVAGVLAFLVYRTELRRKQNIKFDEHIQALSEQPLSEQQHHPTQPASSPTNAAMLLNTYINSGSTTNDEDNDEDKTVLSDIVYPNADVPVGNPKACRMRRCQSFNQPRRNSLQSDNPKSVATNQLLAQVTASKVVDGPSKLKSHRKKGQRAVTLHGLDREQLLLILSLQMRYLQELDQPPQKDSGPTCSANNKSGSTDSSLTFAQMQRRALTPTPRQECLPSTRSADDNFEFKSVKLVRSHTPQPHHFKTINGYDHHQHYQQLQQQQQPSSHQRSLLHQQPQQQLSSSSHQHQQPLLQQQPQQQQSSHQHPLLQQHQQPQQQSSNQQQLNDKEQPTKITYDLRNIKTGTVRYSPVPATQSVCAPSNSSWPPSSSALRQQCPPTSGTSQTQPSTEAFYQQTGDDIISNLDGQSLCQMTTTSQSNSDNFPTNTKKFISSKENVSNQNPMTSTYYELTNESDYPVRDNSGPILAQRTKPKCPRGSDRWQAVMDNGSEQTQTLWENIQRKALSDPNCTGEDQGPEPNAQDDSCYEQSYSIDGRPTHDSSVPPLPPGLTHDGVSSKFVQTRPMDGFNIFTNMPETTFLPPNVAAPTENKNVQYHKNFNPSTHLEPNLHHDNTFIPIDNSSTTDNNSTTDNSDDTDSFLQQTDFSLSHSEVMNGTPNSWDSLEVNRPGYHSPTKLQPKSDRYKGLKSYGEVPESTKFTYPLNRNQNHGQSIEHDNLLSTGREMEGRSYSVDRRQDLNRAVQRNGRHNDMNRVEQENGRRSDMNKGIQNGGKRHDTRSSEEEKRQDIYRSLVDYRRHISDRILEDNRHISNRSTGDNYQTNQDVFLESRPSKTKLLAPFNSSTKPLSSCGSVARPMPDSAQVYQNPYASQSIPGQSNRNLYGISNQSSAFYTLGHGPKSGSLQYSVAGQLGSCDTDLDTLPAPQRKGQPGRGQSLPPPSLHNSLESVARTASTRSGYETSRGRQLTSSELSIPPSGYQDSRSLGYSWNQPPSRYPSCQSDISNDYRYHRPNSKWQSQTSRGLSRELLYVESQNTENSYRQPHVNIRRCQSVDEGNQSTRQHLYTGSLRSGHHDGRGGFYQNINALRVEKMCPDKSAWSAEMTNDISGNTGTHKRQLASQNCQTSAGRRSHSFVSQSQHWKKRPINEIAGYIGVAKMVNSSDSEEFVETVI